MKHATEDDMILAYLGEAETSILGHLDSCAECARRFEALRRPLDELREQAVPEPAPDYEARVWSAIEPRLRSKVRDDRSALWRWVGVAAVMALALGLAFVNRSPNVEPAAPAGVVALDSAAVLDLAISGHLERSQRLLREVQNAPVASGQAFGDRAERMLADNRLLRLAAQRSPSPGVVPLLEELERWLTDVVHLETRTSSLEDVQRRLKDRGLVLKLDVMTDYLGRSPEGEAQRGENDAQTI